MSRNIGESSEKKLIVGVDFGTTFSGCAFVTSNRNVDDIENLMKWPGKGTTEWQAPTKIAYPNQNDSIVSNKWGYEVDSKLNSCSWTKLLLDKGAPLTIFDDPTFLETIKVSEGLFRLPAHRDAQGVCEDYLHEVYKQLVAHLKRKIGIPVFESMPMKCVITLPAIWSEEAKNSTLEAAKRAGFGGGARDSIVTISEPEAGAIALKENILVCDCGGGTVDITTYVISQIYPTLEFDELLAGVGGKCGSTYIDRNFYALMSRRFGKAFDDVPYQNKALDSRFMASFQDAKHGFGAAVDMEALFDPVVAQIISLIRQQVKQALNKKHAVIDRIVLIGGFAESPYLHNAIQRWCHACGDITLMCPPNAQNTVVRGATIHGLHGIVPKSRQARLHYGFSCSMPFREGTDPERYSYIRDQDDSKYCKHRITWILAKDETIFRGDIRSSEIWQQSIPGSEVNSSIILYSSDKEIAPDYTYSRGCIKLSFPPETDFGAAVSSKFSPRLLKTIFEFESVVKVVFGGAGENLTFSVSVNGRARGLAKIDFPHR